MKPDAKVARQFLLVGTSLLPLGIALSAAGESSFGSFVTLLGFAVLVAGLHTFGRAGPDPGGSL